MNIKILDIKIDVISKKEVLQKIKDLLNSDTRGKQLCTTNPEFILAAQKDEEFKNIINNSWLSTVDGYGICLAAKYLNLVKNKKSTITKFLIGMQIAWWGFTRNNKKLDIIKNVITGTDLVPEICQLTTNNQQPTKIFLLGGHGDTPRLAAENLKRGFNGFKGFNGLMDYSVLEIDNITEKINAFQPDILFVALNHPRAQKWIDKKLPNLPSVKLAIGVGGALDYLSGQIKRAPQDMQRSFEWLYRLIHQPHKRLRRIWKATVIFPWNVFVKSL